jgi:hypothetical protein
MPISVIDGQGKRAGKGSSERVALRSSTNLMFRDDHARSNSLRARSRAFAAAPQWQIYLPRSFADAFV